MVSRQPPTTSLAKTLMEQGLPVKQAFLVIGAVVVIFAILFSAFRAYQPSRTSARVSKETSHLQGLAAHWRSTFPSTNYAGIDQIWRLDQQHDRPWAKSPNQWVWEVVPAKLDGSFPVSCGEKEGRCSHFWIRHDYRGNTAMSPKECTQLLMALNVDFDVQSIRRNTMTTSVAENVCDRGKVAATPYLYVVSQ